MAATTTYATVVRIRIERGSSGAYFASSPDVPGFSAVSMDRQELEAKLIPQHLSDLYRAAGQPVVLSRLHMDPAAADDEQPWVAMPFEIARAGVEKLSAAA